MGDLLNIPIPTMQNREGESALKAKQKEDGGRMTDRRPEPKDLCWPIMEIVKD
jgi:hypothetical protein